MLPNGSLAGWCEACGVNEGRSCGLISAVLGGHVWLPSRVAVLSVLLAVLQAPWVAAAAA